VLLSVNLAAQTLPTPHDTGRTGIGKHPVTWPVAVSDPGPKRRGHPRPNGLAGDIVCTTEHHGGTDQAVYAYAREDLDWWERELGYELPAGQFGENLTTRGLDLTGTLVGERWRIGGTVVLQATSPRIPCATFAHRMGEPKWVEEVHRPRRDRNLPARCRTGRDQGRGPHRGHQASASHGDHRPVIPCPHHPSRAAARPAGGR
jgi:MOSC domain-containing protein YiiM